MTSVGTHSVSDRHIVHQDMMTLYAPFFALVFTAYPLGAVGAQILGGDNRIVSWLMRGAVFFLSLAVIVQALRARRSLGGSRLFWFSNSAFWLAYAARMIWDLFLPSHHTLNPSSVYVTFVVGGAVVPMIASCTMLRGEEPTAARHWFATLLSIACTGAVVANLLALTRGSEAVSLIAGGRFGSEVLNPISLGELGALLTLTKLAELASGWRALLSLRAILQLTLGLVVMLAAASRGPLLGVALAIAALILARRRELLAQGGIRLTAIIILLGVLGFQGARLLEDRLGLVAVTRVAEALDAGSDESSTQRITVMRRAVEGFARSPLVGYAFEEYDSQNYPHNVVLDAMMSTGLLGSIPLLLVLGISAAAAYRLLRGGLNEMWVGLVVVQRLTIAFTSDTPWAAGTLWVALGAAVAASGSHLISSSAAYSAATHE